GMGNYSERSPEHRDALSEGIMQAILMPKLKFVGAGILTLVLVTAGGGFVAYRSIGVEEPATSQAQQSARPNRVQQERAKQLGESNVRQLQKERLAVLKQIAADKKALVQQLRATPDVMFEADLAALKAELELCDSDDARIAVLQKIVATARKQEENSEGLW